MCVILGCLDIVNNFYGGGAGDVAGLYLRYQGELLGLCDPQNRDLRRNPPPETKFFCWLIIIPPLDGGVN